jgi:hypothetical protein
MRARTGGLARAPRLDGRWEATIKWLVDNEGLRSATQVRERLQRAVTKEKSAVYGLKNVPDIRTIRARLRRLLPDDGTGPWTMATATEGEAEAVMPVLAAIAQRAEGKVPVFSQRLAHLISTVHAADPDLDAWSVYDLALAYWRRGDEPAEDLDLALAFRACRSPEEYRLFEKWVMEHRAPWVGGRTTVVRFEDGSEFSVPMVEGLCLARQILIGSTARAALDTGIQEAKAGVPTADAATRAAARIDQLLRRIETADTHTDNAEGAEDSAAGEGADGSAQV